MGLEVIGAGLGRTGTTSLKLALGRLGLCCYHTSEIERNPGHDAVWARAARGEPVEWDDLFRGYRAAVDFFSFWKPLSEYFSDSKVILTVRDPEKWYESFATTVRPLVEIVAEADNNLMRAFRQQVFVEFFGDRFDDKHEAIRRVKRHNEEVRRSLPADRLLVFESSQGWGPLCEFLEQPVPDEPYPRANDRASFGRRWRRAILGRGLGGTSSPRGLRA